MNVLGAKPIFVKRLPNGEGWIPLRGEETDPQRQYRLTQGMAQTSRSLLEDHLGLLKSLRSVCPLPEINGV